MVTRRLHIICTLALGVLILTAFAPAPAPIRFQDIAQPAGLHFVTENSPTPEKHQPETMPAGVALFDYDGDGRLDIYLVNGAEMPSLVKTSSKYYNRLFHNNSDGTFSDVTAKAGVAGAGFGMGAAIGDYDNDGWPDLYLANVNGNQLFHNNGDGTFSDVTAKAGVMGAQFNGRKMWSISAGWFDYNNDGLLDLFVSNYCQWDPKHEPACMGLNGRGYCHPNSYGPLPNTLYRNNGDGTFTDVSEATGIAAVQGKGMGVAFADYDGDGFMDVFVANDNSANLLFHNRGGKKFEEAAFQAGVAYNEDGNALAGMGAEFRDLNNDGLPDIWHTAIENETFPLFLNRGAGRFENVTITKSNGAEHQNDVGLVQRRRRPRQRWLERPVRGARQRDGRYRRDFAAFSLLRAELHLSQPRQRALCRRQRDGRRGFFPPGAEPGARVWRPGQ